MREIKFRAIAADSRYNMENHYRKMIYSNSLIQMSGEDEEVYLKLNGEGWIEVDEKTVGQYTGLKDKNAKGIYEGDIVRLAFIADTVGVVTWETDGWKIIDEVGAMYQWDERTEVIGNIYENPELLERI